MQLGWPLGIENNSEVSVAFNFEQFKKKPKNKRKTRDGLGLWCFRGFAFFNLIDEKQVLGWDP